jgi:amidase
VNDLIYRSAGELARLVREREASAVEVVEAHLARIEQRNPALNAVVTLDADGALAQARAIDGGSGRDGALAGVPIALKDCHETAGMRTTSGHPPLADYVPADDGTVAARLRAAGAIVIGKTNVSQLLADSQSDNPVFGRSNNPWNLERTPGGSSGGAAAAIAAGMVPLDIGSDIGGSIRMPAHCCGIVGIKPTERRVSNHGHIPDLPGDPRGARYMNSIGPLARDIDDLALALSIIEGPDGHDLDVPPTPAGGLPNLPDLPLDGLAFAFAMSFPGLPASSDTRAAIKRVVAEIGAAGGKVEERLPEIDFDEQIAIRATLRRYVRIFTEPPAEPLRAEGLFHALDRRDHFIRAWQAFLNEQVLICPVMMTTAFPHCPRDTPVTVDGVEHPYSELGDYCRPFNLTGHPVVTIPVALDRDGLPIGIQIVGPLWSDARLLSVAKAISAIVQPIGWPPAQ